MFPHSIRPTSATVVYTFVLILVLLSLLCTSCTKEASYRRTLSLVHYFTGSLSPAFTGLERQVDDAKSNYRLVSTPLEHENFKQTILLQLESPEPPDLFTYWAGEKTRVLVEDGLVQSLGKQEFTDYLSENMPENVLATLRYKNELYMLPLNRHYVGFLYNRAVFKRLGLDVPNTWADFVSVLQTVSDAGVQPLALGAKNKWPAQFWFDFLLLRTAGYTFREALMAGTESWQDARVKRVFDLWHALLVSGFFNQDASSIDWDEASRLVLQGKAAMTLMGTWMIGQASAENYPEGKDYGFFEFPTMDRPSALAGETDTVALGPIDGILISSKSGADDMVSDLLARMAQPEVQKELSLRSGSLSPHRAVKASDYPPLRRSILLLLEDTSHWSFNFDLACNYELAERGLDLFKTFVGDPESGFSLLAGFP